MLYVAYCSYSYRLKIHFLFSCNNCNLWVALVYIDVVETFMYLFPDNLFVVCLCLASKGHFPGPTSTAFLDTTSTAGPTKASLPIIKFKCF